MTSHHLIREARRRAGLTQSELAVRAKTTQSAIARWETGRSQPSLEKLMQLVDCCGLELSYGLSARADDEWELLAGRRTLSPEVRLEQLVAGVTYWREVGEPGPRAGPLDERAPAPFDPRSLLATLVRHEVAFIVIGAGAAVLHGSPLLTRNLDITPARDPHTLEQLGRALYDLDARPTGAQGAPGAQGASDDADPLRVESLPAHG
ncbi:MAG: helix-turn-helix transcriptional regulator, partial [Gemmatimonadota bacterium]